MKKPLITSIVIAAIVSSCGGRTKETISRTDDYGRSTETNFKAERMVEDNTCRLVVIDSPEISLRYVGVHGMNDTAVLNISASRLYGIRNSDLTMKESSATVIRDTISHAVTDDHEASKETSSAQMAWTYQLLVAAIVITFFVIRHLLRNRD